MAPEALSKEAEAMIGRLLLLALTIVHGKPPHASLLRSVHQSGHSIDQTNSATVPRFEPRNFFLLSPLAQDQLEASSRSVSFNPIVDTSEVSEEKLFGPGAENNEPLPRLELIPDLSQLLNRETVTRATSWRQGEREPVGFGLYSYLLFGSQGGNNLVERLAAARAYLTAFPAFDDPNLASIPPRELNLFQAPMRAQKTLEQWSADGAEEFLKEYDYTRARLILNKIGSPGDGIYLVSYFAPITDLQQVDSRRLLVQDLSYVPANLIGTWLLEFRRQVRRPAYWDQLTFRNAMLKVRSALPLIAELVRVTGSAAAADIFPKRAR